MTGEDDHEPRCHVHKGVFIPGCMGAAAMGRSHCTCPLKPLTHSDLEKKFIRVHEMMIALTDKIADLAEEVRKMRNREKDPRHKLTKDRR